MAWIESHQSLGEHPKTKKLCRLLGISKAQAIGHLHMLWWWALDYAQDGSLARYDDLDVAIGAEWEGDEAAFVGALASSGFLDNDRLIHDWHDYAGKLIERRERNAQRMRDARAGNDPDTNNERASHVQGTQRARVQLQNQPNQTKPTEPTQPPPQPPKGERVRASKPMDLSGFDEWYEIYPRHVGRTPAEAEWSRLKPDDRAAALVAIRAQLSWPTFAAVPIDKIPHPTTWLHQRRWTDEPPRGPTSHPGSNGRRLSVVEQNKNNLEEAKRILMARHDRQDREPDIIETQGSMSR